MSGPTDGVELPVNKCTFTIQIEAAVEENVFYAPCFRYRFPISQDMQENAKKQTTTIGTNGWTADVAKSTNGMPLFRYEHIIPDIMVTESVALALDEDPIMSFILSDQPPGVKVDPSSSLATGRGKLIADIFDLDLSGFFTGALLIEQTWTNDRTTSEEDPSNVFSKKVSASSSHAHSLFTPHSGIQLVTIRVRVDHPFLSGPVKHKLNPITFTLCSLRGLPGVAGPSTSSPYDPLITHCRPVYALFQFFPHYSHLYRITEPEESKQPNRTKKGGRVPPRKPSRQHRVIITPGHRHHPTIKWNYEISLLAGRCDPIELYDALRASVLTIEVHDRDLFNHQTFSKLQEKWESLSTTGLDPGDPKPLSPFAVDEIALQDWRTWLLHAGERCSYGAASFRFDQLLIKSTSIKVTSDLVAMKWRATPIGSNDLNQDPNLSIIDATPMERMIREPGTYLATGTTLSLRATLHTPLNPSSPTLFSRLVLIFPYHDTTTLTQLMKQLEQINSRVFPHVSLRSYQFTDMEKKQCEDGTLDILTGIMILDTKSRIVILEGRCDTIQHVEQVFPRSPQTSYRLLANPHLTFSHRLYTVFDLDLKRIKLRECLPTLLMRPEIYRRTQVSESCYLALTRLNQLCQANSLNEAKEMNCFPLASMLIEIESKYGESISLEDINGKGFNPSISSSPSPLSPNKVDQSTCSRIVTRLKGPTETRNVAYEQAKAQFQAHDYLAERKKESQVQQQRYQQEKQDQTREHVVLYSGQKLRTQDRLQEELRHRLAMDKHATYTYGPDYQSLACSLVNPEEIREYEEKQARKKWTTKRGFVYPAPRSHAQDLKHPHAPSTARREELQQPFIEPCTTIESKPLDPLKPAFSTLPSKDMIFGGTNGDGSKNPMYFKSVHLCGQALQNEMKEALVQAQEEWERKIVVDRNQLHFVAHGNTQGYGRNVPSQLDKLQDIVKGPIQSKALRIVRHATLPSGKHVPFESTPVSIMDQQAYTDSSFTTLLRSHHGKGFSIPTTTHLLTPPTHQFTTTTHVKPLRDDEKKGLIWGNNQNKHD